MMTILLQAIALKSKLITDEIKRRPWLATVLIMAFLFAVFVWPTAWRYDRVNYTTARTNRFTGKVEVLSTLNGWEIVEPQQAVNESSVSSVQSPEPPPYENPVPPAGSYQAPVPSGQ